MAKLRYFALKDDLGFPIPSTLRGYLKDPCKCELIEISGNVTIPEEVEEFRHYHPEGLHYFFLVKGNCCDVVPNSLIVTRNRPKGKYKEFINIPELFSQVVIADFTKDDCADGEIPDGVVPYSKTYYDTTQEGLTAKIAADSATFDTEGQANANTEGTCIPEV